MSLRKRAASDSSGGILNPKGLDLRAVAAHKEATGSLQGYRDIDPISSEKLLEFADLSPDAGSTPAASTSSSPAPMHPEQPWRVAPCAVAVRWSRKVRREKRSRFTPSKGGTRWGVGSGSRWS